MCHHYIHFGPFNYGIWKTNIIYRFKFLKKKNRYNIKYINYYPNNLFVRTRNFFIQQKIDKIVEQKMFECAL
jgi:hypothetical protein